ncbi:glucokinase [Lachnospiraceae bacterium]|uniref:ROK family glucokinase n=1 Tax=Candidatus Merdisoma sp. JLR.KK011 TaxID=3114299 RepID=UPI001433620F|nr:glucokinase [Lachnospiraceae bacterium]
MKKYCFGADIGGTTVKLGLFDTEGNILDKWEIKTHTENEGSAILPDTAAAILAKMEERKLNPEEVAGIGVGVPGPVSIDGIVPHTANLGWGYKEVTKELSERTGLPCKAGNDANVAALGEMWMGGAKGHKDVLLLTLGTGVGGGIIVDGKILTGAHGAGGEIGHIHVEDQIEEHCGCGNQGCLEQFASATGIARLARAALAESEEPSILREGEVTAKAVFDALKEGDELAKRVVERFGRYLGTAISVMAGILDPEVIVIGGGVSKAGWILLDYIRRYYKPYAYKSSKETEFALAQLGNDAGIYGCAKLILD